jgi:hypothetical protein
MDSGGILAGVRNTQVQTALVSVSGAGQNTIFSTPNGKRVVILGLVLSAPISNTVALRLGSVDVSGAMTLAIGVPLVVLSDGMPLAEGADGASIILTLGGATLVTGWIIYCLM